MFLLIIFFKDFCRYVLILTLNPAINLEQEQERKAERELLLHGLPESGLHKNLENLDHSAQEDDIGFPLESSNIFFYTCGYTLPQTSWREIKEEIIGPDRGVARNNCNDTERRREEM